jgi:hypothetical protein
MIAEETGCPFFHLRDAAMIDQSQRLREFDEHAGRSDAARAVADLQSGLALLAEGLYIRLHEDVEKVFGADSMLMPVSESKSRRNTKTEIELYQIAESAAAVRDFGYLPAGDAWYVPWLAGLRLEESPLTPPHRQRLDRYLSKDAHARELVFADVLAAVLPESRRAPLVLFRLFPLAVQIATALAFADRPRAERARAAQIDHLAVIADCRACRGRVLASGERCRDCGNPLWETRWLASVE